MSPHSNTLCYKLLFPPHTLVMETASYFNIPSGETVNYSYCNSEFKFICDLRL